MVATKVEVVYTAPYVRTRLPGKIQNEAAESKQQDGREKDENKDGGDLWSYR